jgi:hypothetical protein
MAVTKEGRLSMGFYMSDTNPKTKTNKVATVAFRVTSASVDAYNAAADSAARAATTIGELIDALENLTLGVLKNATVGYVYEENLAPPASDTFAFEFDKFLISLRDDVNNSPVKTSIPARNDAAIVIESDGTTVDITAPDMSTYVDLLHTVMLSEDANAVTALRAVISS